MADLYATPDGRERMLPGGSRRGLHLQEALNRARPGDTVHLLPGVYEEPVTIGDKQAGEHPITIGSDGCATLDGRRSVLRPGDIEDIGWGSYAFIRIRRSSGVVIENATIQNAWPTAIYVQDVQNLTVRKMNLNGATYGIVARGTSTEHITLEHCSWIQDTRIWDEVSWQDIHDRPNPRRELDGDFFRSLDIKGNVIVRNNFISHAFNGIHLFASKEAAARGDQVNENVWIYRNTFSFIRDSAIEAERTAYNWWVFENKIYNCHTWFAFEECRGGFWYVFANRGWFSRKPGPPHDCHTGGAVIKTNKAEEEGKALPQHPYYVFNNSWYLRSPILKKGKLQHFRHFNNAIAFARPEHHHDGVVDVGRRMIGVGAPDPKCDGDAPPDAPFTTEWNRLGIVFCNDVCDHPDLAAGLNRTGYPIEAIYGNPRYCSAREGDFRLDANSPCLRAGRSFQLELPNERTWQLPDGLDAGAMCGKLPYTPDDLGCPLDLMPPGYNKKPRE